MSFIRSSGCENIGIVIEQISDFNKKACSKVDDENVNSILTVVEKSLRAKDDDIPRSQQWSQCEQELSKLWQKFSSKCSLKTKQRIHNVQALVVQHLQKKEAQVLRPEQFLRFDCMAQKVALLQRVAEQHAIKDESFMQGSIAICNMFDAIDAEAKVRKTLLRKLHEEKSSNEVKIDGALENDQDDSAASLVRENVTIQRSIDSLEREPMPSVHIQGLIIAAKASEKSKYIGVCEEVISRVKERTDELQQLLRQMPYKQFLQQLEKFESTQRLSDDAAIRTIRIPSLSHAELCAVDEGNVQTELAAAEQLIARSSPQAAVELSPAVFIRDFERVIYRVGSKEFGAVESTKTTPLFKEALVGVNKALNALVEEQLDKVAHLHFKDKAADFREAIVNTIRAQIESFWHQGMIKPAIAPLLAALVPARKEQEQEYVLINHSVPATMQEVGVIKKSVLATENSIEQALLFRNWTAQKDPLDTHALLFRATGVQKVVRIKDRNGRPMGYVYMQAQIKVDFSKIKLPSEEQVKTFLLSPGVLSCTSSVRYADAVEEL